jgi:cytochrome c553
MSVLAWPTHLAERHTAYFERALESLNQEREALGLPRVAVDELSVEQLGTVARLAAHLAETAAALGDIPDGAA